MLPLDRSQVLGFDFRRSAVSGDEGTLLPSDQSRTTLNLLHQYKTKSLNVNSDFRFDRQNHNFYGISQGDRTNFDSSVSDNIDSKQNLNYLSIRSKWQWYESPFSKLYFNTSITTDYFDTTENILKINTQLRLPLFGQYLEVTPGFQLVNTDFKTGYFFVKPLSFEAVVLKLVSPILVPIGISYSIQRVEDCFNRSILDSLGSSFILVDLSRTKANFPPSSGYIILNINLK